MSTTPRHAEARRLLDTGHPEQALAAYRALDGEDPRNLHTLCGLVAAYQALGQHTTARDALIRDGDLRMEDGYILQAVVQYQRAVRLDAAGSGRACLKLGRAYGKTGLAAEARFYLLQAIAALQAEGAPEAAWEAFVDLAPLDLGMA
jgi:tetratricopeptide (TPR) repeat protein